jgi:hypothetical protein
MPAIQLAVSAPANILAKTVRMSLENEGSSGFVVCRASLADGEWQTELRNVPAGEVVPIYHGPLGRAHVALRDVPPGRHRIVIRLWFDAPSDGRYPCRIWSTWSDGP